MRDPVKKRKKAGILVPSAISVEKQRAALPFFEPINLEKVRGKKRTSGDFSDLDEAILVLAFKDQSETLLMSLGIDIQTANCWERGFFILARLHHGAGQLEVGLPNLNAKKWMEAHDRLLCAMVWDLTLTGLSADRALKTIAKDPSKWRLFPTYMTPRSSKPEIELRFMRLQDRWKKHSKKLTFRMRLEAALGIPAPCDRSKRACPPPQVVENKDP